MKAGLYSLFSRSLYRGSASRLRELKQGSEEYQRIHEERERFAAAAIAFCLEHDKDFKKHFLKAICGCKLLHGFHFEVEPYHWSDLLVKADKFLCAVEIKIGAELNDHQNPDCEDFTKPKGYGHYLKEKCGGLGSHKGRYVVLGWAKGKLKKKRIYGLEVQQRQWEDLEKRLPSSPMIDDLVSLLSSFDVWAFRYRAMKNKRVSGKLGGIADATKILDSVREQLKWPDSKAKITARSVANHGELGIYLCPFVVKKQKKPAYDSARKLVKRNSPSNEAAWFGYLQQSDEPTQRCVYAYCSKQRRAHLVKRLKTARFVVDDAPGSDRDGPAGDYCAIVRRGRNKLDDQEWFKTILEVAAAR